MTPQPLTNLAMWAIYRPSGEIIFSSIGYTKEESLSEYFGARTREMPVAHERKGFEVLEIAIDIVAINR